MTEAVETSRPFIDKFEHTLELATPPGDLLVNADQTLRDAVNQVLDQLLADRTIQDILAKYGLTYLAPFTR